jgi:hypothetical protein
VFRRAKSAASAVVLLVDYLVTTVNRKILRFERCRKVRRGLKAPVNLAKPRVSWEGFGIIRKTPPQ